MACVPANLSVVCKFAACNFDRRAPVVFRWGSAMGDCSFTSRRSEENHPEQAAVSEPQPLSPAALRHLCIFEE